MAWIINKLMATSNKDVEKRGNVSRECSSSGAWNPSHLPIALWIRLLFITLATINAVQERIEFGLWQCSPTLQGMTGNEFSHFHCISHKCFLLFFRIVARNLSKWRHFMCIIKKKRTFVLKLSKSSKKSTKNCSIVVKVLSRQLFLTPLSQ